MKTQRRLRAWKRHTRKRGGRRRHRGFQGQAPEAGTGAAGTGAAGTGTGAAGTGTGAAGTGTGAAGPAAAAAAPSRRPAAPIAVPPAQRPYEGPFGLRGPDFFPIDAGEAAERNADNLRRILRMGAFRPDAKPPRTKRGPLLYASMSSELDVSRRDPLYYHISSACGSNYDDLAARLSYALSAYQLGVPYYDVALELVTNCRQLRIATAVREKKLDEKHASEMRILTNLITAIENCRSIGATSVEVFYAEVDWNEAWNKPIYGFVLHVPPGEYVWPPNSKTPVQLDGFTVGRNTGVKPNYLE